ncbi:rod shape determining protein RodA [Lipingzhangella halophila]|uniref:peptidoglycan glycosyltransferase n=1 Tax=Lipingzhangella halophila TaxID=1783352 RepID=A0A7W7RJP0_9ACTN|nr:rod shape-determining protein RodA [Lipingzhangella halophila]MBB4933204.1 rod shape determining protein RodA [Lipingzhangella halophila]
MTAYTSPHVARATWRGYAERVLAAGARRRVDWLLVVPVVLLSALGTLLVWTSTHTAGAPDVATGYVQRHLIHLGVAVLCGLLVASVDYRTPRAYAPIVYLLSLAGLVLVFTPLGEVINGSRGWLVVGGLQAQPSEFVKVALILAVAMLLGEPRDGERAPTTRDVLFSLVALAGPMAMVLLQPDLGTGLVLGAIFLAMLSMSGAPVRWIVGMLGCGLAAVLCVWWFDLLEPYQLARVTTLFDPTADPQGRGYNANQALIAVGSGGFEGTGLFQGEQTSGRFVPEQHTDFIFTVAAEELGFVGGVAIVALLTLVIWRVLHVATGCEQPYARLVCVGVAAWLGFQAFINIGMTLGVAPITGLPLPFLSYGGTATIATLMAIGLVLAIHARDRGFE